MDDRYLCQGMVLEVLARELFLQGKIICNEIPENKAASGNSKEHGPNRLSSETSKIDVSHLSDVISTCFASSTIENLIRSYSSSGYDKDVILRAKVSNWNIL